MSATPPIRPAFVGSRFVQSQFIALARHTVLRRPVLTMYGKFLKQTGTGAVVPVAERARRNTQNNEGHDDDDDPDLQIDPNTRVLFAVRPPPHIIGGIVGCCWNVALGTVVSPIVALTVFWQTMNKCPHGRYIGALWGVGGAAVWGLSFAVMGMLSGSQQLAIGTANQLAGPYYCLISSGPNRRYWSTATSRYIAPRAAPQPEVVHYKASEEMILEAMKRQSSRAKRSAQDRGMDSAYDRDGNLKAEKAKQKKSERSYYDTLNIDSSATEKEIKAAYANLAMKLHPDRNPSKTAHEEFDELTKAYRTLANADKRRRYDAAGISGSEDIGSKKRTAIRSFFGGDDLAALVGDVRRNNFNRRFIDETDFPVLDLAVLNERTEDACLRELIDKYLQGFPLHPTVAMTVEHQQQKQQQQHLASEGTVGAAAAVTSSPSMSASFEARMAQYDAEKKEWEQKVKKLILKYTNVALAKEVLFIVGTQYLLTMQLCGPTVPAALMPARTQHATSVASPDAASPTTAKTDGDKLMNAAKKSGVRTPSPTSTASANASPAPVRLNLRGGVIQRATLYATAVLPRWLQQTAAKVTHVFKLNPSVSKDPSIIIDFVWKLSVTELQQTAHRIALRALCDADVSDAERRRRLDAMVELATIFTTHGKVYSTVDKRTLEMMTDSLRQYYAKSGKRQ